MLAKIGPYKEWISPYQIADYLQHIGISEDRCFKIGEYLEKTWINDFCRWINSRKKRYIKVRIDNFDSWNIDNTLAVIMVPLLQRFKKTNHGAAFVDDEDVPEELRSASCAPKENPRDIDANYFARFDWLLDELIWTFEQLHPDTDGEAQFYSGESDIKFENIEGIEFSRMVPDPKSTFKVDREGLDAYKKRVQNGCCLFGKYLQALWD